MRILVSALFLAGLALAPPALAGPKGADPAAAPAVAPSSDPAAKLIADVAAYTADFQTLMGDDAQFFSDYMDGAQRALLGPPGDTAWVEGWMTQTRSRLAALRARRAALRPPPPELIARLKAAGLAEDAKALQDTPGQMGAAIDAVLDLCDQVLVLAPDAARGDAAARANLKKLLIRGARTAVVSENALMQAGLLRTEPGDPQGALVRSILASNSAMITLMDLAALLDENPKADPKPLVAQMMSSLEKARSEASKVGPLAKRMIAQIQDEPGDPGLKARVTTALGTYEESGRVETQIVDTMQAMLTATDPAKSQALGEDLQSLVQRRLQLQVSRQAALGG